MHCSKCDKWQKPRKFHFSAAAELAVRQFVHDSRIYLTFIAMSERTVSSEGMFDSCRLQCELLGDNFAVAIFLRKKWEKNYRR